MKQGIIVPVTAFTSLEIAIQKINDVVADKNIRGIFYNKSSLMKGEIEILVGDNTQKVVTQQRPMKARDNTTSQYYCVYKHRGKWTYKFERKGKKYWGKKFDTELAAAQAYDSHVFSVDGHTSKLNFPEEYMKEDI